jgi:hypothetical protein
MKSWPILSISFPVHYSLLPSYSRSLVLVTDGVCKVSTYVLLMKPKNKNRFCNVWLSYNFDWHHYNTLYILMFRICTKVERCDLCYAHFLFRGNLELRILFFEGALYSVYDFLSIYMKHTVGTADGHRLESQGVSALVRATIFPLCISQTGSGAHPAFSMGTRGSFQASKAAGAWSWPLTSD